MSASTSASVNNRALSPLEAVDVSISYRRAVAADYSDVHLGQRYSAAGRDAGSQYSTVGAALLPLMEELCEALGLQGRVESEACGMRAQAGGGGPNGRRRHSKMPPTDVSIRRQALRAVITEVRMRHSPCCSHGFVSDPGFPNNRQRRSKVPPTDVSIWRQALRAVIIKVHLPGHSQRQKQNCLAMHRSKNKTALPRTETRNCWRYFKMTTERM